jgi:hypothetical protein
MKRVTIYCCALIALSIALASCGDDDKGAASKFTYDGKSYNLTKGFAEFDGIYVAGTDDYYYWVLYLTSNGITIDDDDDFEGTGDAVILEIRAKNDDSFVPTGSYEFDDDLAYSYGVYTNFSPGTGSGTSYTDIDDVSITVGKSGNTFTINFTITLGDNSVVKGSYKGGLTEIDP